MSSPPPRLFPFRFFHFHTFSFSLDKLQNCNSQHNISFSLFLPKFWHSIFFFFFLSHTRILLYLLPSNIHHTPVHSRFFSFTHFTRVCKHTYKPLENHTYTGCRARLYFRSIVDSENKNIPIVRISVFSSQVGRSKSIEQEMLLSEKRSIDYNFDRS